ncbi:MAG TPA: N-acetylmuramic acid 6-phosphate etherase [Gemmatimonadota bacterium]|nr:N-acetylmuramic acid 6-phosphate etherase [Gemmatimonadota bacterium]
MNPRTTAIDRASAAEIVRLIQAEDRRVPEALEAQADELAALIEEVARRMGAGGRLVYVGAGTSGRLGVLDAAECPPTFGTEPDRVVGLIAGGEGALVRSREGAEDDRAAGRADVRGAEVGPADFVLGIAASGTTPYVAAAAEEASRLGAGTGLLTCSPPPEELAGLADHVVTLLTGPEVIAGSTRMKAGTATKLALNTLSTGVMVRLGKVYGNLMVDLQAGSRKLVGRGLRILERVCGLRGEPARELLVRAGGSVKTAIAMHELGVGRAAAERVLDACGGFLGEVVERWRGRGEVPYYACYPEALEPGEPERILERLAAGPERLRAAFRARGGLAVETGGAGGEAGEAEGAGRTAGGIPRPGGWTPARHVAHLAEAERECYRPRLEALIRARAEGEAGADGGSSGAAEPGAGPVFEDWPPSAEPPLGGKSAPEVLLAFAAERGRTVALLREAPAGAWEAPGTVAGERIRLHQLVRAMIQHDGAHAARIRERIHPDLVRPHPDPSADS